MAEKDEEKAVNFADDLSQSSASASGSMSHSDGTIDTSSMSTSSPKKDGTTPTEIMAALFFSRMVVAVSLVVLTIAAGVTAFFVSHNTQEEFLESQVSVNAFTYY
jgi:hypothetical protein